jgi:Protein of unknown function (DUF3592)
MRPRSWVVFPSLRGVLVAGQVVLTVMMVAGAICLVVGAKALVDARLFVAKAAAANGVVVDVAEAVERVQKRSPGGDWYYEDVTVFHPVVRFVTAREQAVRFKASEGSGDPFAYGVGDSIRVLYDPANPQAARLDTWASRWGDSVVLGMVGLALASLGGLGFWLFRSPGRAARRAARQNQDANGGAGPAPTP